MTIFMKCFFDNDTQIVIIISCKVSKNLRFLVNTMCFLILFWIMPFASHAQADTIRDNIFLLTRPTTDSILLRWAPGNHMYWDLGNRYGYKLVRNTILRDTVLLSDPKETYLSFGVFLPLPLPMWEQIVKTNRHGAIAAQALYGESFVADAGEGFTPQSITFKSKEQIQRFSFALYAADVSPQVARASGLWFTDSTARENEKYLYRVFFNLPDSLAHLNDTAFVFTGIRDYQPLPKPFDVSAQFGDRTALLSWNTYVHDNIYIAWEFERSANGRVFEPLNINPQVRITPENIANTEYAFRMDSLPQNNREYFYRLRGISSFGERGPWSEVVSGKGIETIDATPNITGHEIIKERVVIRWEFPVETQGEISGFRILRSSDHKQGFEEIYSKLKPDERSFTDNKPLGTNYYKVVAYLDGIDSKHSFPYLVQLSDHIPPVKPTGLAGTVDSMGVVTLTWAANSDEDLYGYRVFRSASGNDEYSQRTHRPVADTLYIDTISKKDLNAAVFYKIVAIDRRQNQSEFSDVAELIKPDDIPPSIPVIINTKATPEGIQLTWINSTSDDVARHKIYRIVQGDTAWIRIAEIQYKHGNKVTVHTDTDCSVEKANQYKVMAADKSGNISESSISVAIRGLRNNDDTEKLRKINKEVDFVNGKIYLNWQLPDKPVKLIRIYRKTSENPYTLIETLQGESTGFEDQGMRVGDHYNYRIKLVYHDGSVSGFSDEIKIEY